MKTIPCLVSLLLLSFTEWNHAEEKLLPDLPKGELTYVNRGASNIRVKNERIEIQRGTNRIAEVRKIDRDNDGKFEDYIFSAFVGSERVLVLTRLFGSPESAQFYSCDDVMVHKDLTAKEFDGKVLLVASRKHNWWEVFVRNADGCYWPADQSTAEKVHALFSAGAGLVEPLVKTLKESQSAAPSPK